MSSRQLNLLRCAGLLCIPLLCVAMEVLLRQPGPGLALAQMRAPLTDRALKQVDSGFLAQPPNAPAAHASSLVAMPEDSSALLTAAWFAGEREGAPDVQIAAAQWDKKTQQWSAPRTILNRHSVSGQLGFGIRRLGNPVLWVDAEKRLHVFVVATGFGGWATGRILHMRQNSRTHQLDDLSFEPMRVLPLSWVWNISYLVRGAPLPLQDGGMVLPVYFEIGIKFPMALRFDKNGAFQSMVRISRRGDVLQPSLLTMSPTHWLALMRSHDLDGQVGVASTHDAGVHWSDEPDLGLINPDTSVAALSIDAKHHVLALNTSPRARNQLDLYQVTGPTTAGTKWDLSTPLAGAPVGEFSYPSLAWAGEDLWVSYTDNRRQIAWRRFAWQPVQTEAKQ